MKTFQYALLEEGKSMSSVVEGLIEQWLMRRRSPVLKKEEQGRSSPILTSEDVVLIRHLATQMSTMLDREGATAIPPAAAIKFLDSAPLVAVIKNTDGGVLWGNRKYLKLTGKTQEEVRGKNAIQIWGKTHGGVIRRHENQVIAGRGEGKMFVEAIAVGDLLRLRETFRFPIFNEKGDEVVMLGVLALDWEQAVRAYDEFAGAARPDYVESLQPQIFHSLPLPMAVTDGDGLIRYSNPAYLAMTGRPADLRQMALANLWPSGIAAGMLRECQQVPERGGKRVAFERLQQKRGQRRELMTVRFRVGEASSRLVAAISFDVKSVYHAADLVTELERGGASFAAIEKCSLRRGSVRPAIPNKLLKQILEDMPIVLTLKDMEGRILYGNREFEKLIQQPFEQIVGELPTDHWPARVGSTIMKLDRWVRDQNAPILSVERIPIKRKPRNRMTVRFPIVTEAGTQATASLGFDLEWLSGYAERWAAEAFRHRAAGIYAAEREPER